jgi:hypothetical protein
MFLFCSQRVNPSFQAVLDPIRENSERYVVRDLAI